MMNAKQILEYLQTRSPQVKNRIVAAGGLVAMLALGSIWINSIESQLGGLDGDGTDAGKVAGSQVSIDNRITLESAQTADGKTTIHFRITNDTPDILSFSPPDRIEFKAGSQTLIPERVLDRQGGEFVKKVLSGATAYGTLVFPEPENKQGTITFDDLFFEQKPGAVFKEILEIDLEALPTPAELRS